MPINGEFMGMIPKYFASVNIEGIGKDKSKAQDAVLEAVNEDKSVIIQLTNKFRVWSLSNNY